MFVAMRYPLRTGARASKRGSGAVIAGALLALTGFAARPGATAAAPAPSWVTYSHAGAGTASYGRCVATDGAGNVYVSGNSGGDYFTVKYSPQGQAAWTARYDGPGHGLDVPAAIAVDGDGNVYVTGSSFGGSVQRGGSDYDYATVKYSPVGQQLWVARYNGTANGTDAATALAVGPGGVYVTGTSESPNDGTDIVTIRYSLDGAPIWTDRLDGSGGADHAAALAVDLAGNVIVTGDSWSGAHDYDYLTVSYDWSGARNWVAAYDGPGHGADSATGVAVDELGNVYVTGSSDGGAYLGGGTGLDYATLRYSSLGTAVWIARYDSGERLQDQATAIALDLQGNPVVTGESRKAASGYDFLTISYDAGGNTRWTGRYNGPGNANDMPAGLAVDPSGSVYVAGAVTVTYGMTGWSTLKYGADGSAAWTARFDGAVTGTCAPAGLALRGSDSVVVAGSAWGTVQAPDFTTVAYPGSVPVPPAAPANLQAAFASGAVTLTWQESDGSVTGFKIQRKSGSGSFGQVGTATAGAGSFTDGNVSAGATYTYQVIASNGAGDSVPSGSASVTVPGGAPGKIQVSPAKLNFGTVKRGTVRTKSIKIKNSGKGTLTVTLTGSAAPFAVTQTSFAVAPKQSQSVPVTFSPSAAATASGSLTIQSNDPARPSLTVTLTGKGK